MNARLSHLPDRPWRRSLQHGVTLVELMVGLVIGLLAVLAITQVTLLYEGRKRTITAGADAQVSGAVALQSLQAAIQASGYGLTEGGAVGCRIVGVRQDTALRFEQTLAPVVIHHDDTTGVDALDVLNSDSSDFAVPTRVASNHLRGSNVFVVDANTLLGQRQGDLMLAVPSPTPNPTDPNQYCSLFTLSSDPVADSNELRHDADPNNPWNHDPSSTVFPGMQTTDVAYATGSYLLNLGNLIRQRYCLTGLGNTLCENASTGQSTPNTLRQLTYNTRLNLNTPYDLAPNIVSLQAVYGRDTSSPADMRPDLWTRETPSTTEQWQRTVAIRVAVVARSIQSEKRPDSQNPFVTTEPPVWHPDGVTPTPIDISRALKLSPGDDWRHYRYKVFETVIPLRNQLWQASAS